MSRIREKDCDLCRTPAPTLFRCRFEASGHWRFLCKGCWETVSQSTLYVYGGTWKAQKP
ncbi:MAG: hypothetical protein MH252_09855 [Thermosynechococcaceae cyanobacterium MS004]|nr:hypothetical protein [Thermosynechococcaceae cyanobacterium MS004]